MIKSIKYSNLLFIDIETVPQYYQYDDLPSISKVLFDKKTHQQQEYYGLTTDEIYTKKAGILAEFGKIVCISCGIITSKDTFRIKSFYGYDEKKNTFRFQ